MAGDLHPLSSLRFWAQSGSMPLPAWARFMISLGERVATSGPEKPGLVVALSVPARAFAATLIAASAVITAFREGPSASDAAAHFDYLASLADGTAITHHRANSVQQGRLVGVEASPYDGRPVVRIRLRKEDRLLPVGLCREIQVIDDPGTLKVRREKLIRHPAFLSSALPGIDVAVLSASSRLDCVIVGAKQLLEDELIANEFAAGDGKSVYTGSLQEIVRARNVTAKKGAYRSALVSAISEDADVPVSSSPPGVVVFDGARAFNNYRSRWPSSKWVVILDRGLPSAQEGAAAVNQGYATRADDSDVLARLAVPPGIEALSYVERR